MEECLKARGKIMNKKYFRHLSAIITIIIWGTTFISTKVLLKEFQPIEILVIRFVIGFIILCMISYQPIKTNQLKEEGKDIINLAGGEPNFYTPKRVKDAQQFFKSLTESVYSV